MRNSSINSGARFLQLCRDCRSSVIANVRKFCDSKILLTCSNLAELKPLSCEIAALRLRLRSQRHYFGNLDITAILSLFCILLGIVFALYTSNTVAHAQESQESSESAEEETETPESNLQEIIAQSWLQDFNANGVLEIFAFGNSITRGVGDFISAGSYVELGDTRTPSGEAGYPLRIELLLGIPVSNLGEPGERITKEGVYRFAREILNSPPDIVIISGGSNDALDRTGANTYFRSLQTIINIAKASGTQPVLMSIPPSCCEHSGIHAPVRTYNAELEQLSAINNIPLADVYHAFSNTCDLGYCYLLNRPEGLHPNSAGYDVIGETVVATLLRIDLFQAEGQQILESALGLTPGSLRTVPDPIPAEENQEGA